jgi:Tfp pilus assembly protein PilE
MRTPRTRSGLTRVDLLFATAVVGVLGAIIWGNLRQTRANAYIDVLTDELRAVQVAEERYWTQHARYAMDTTQLAWNARPEVRVTFSSADPALGVEATATHRSAPGVSCRLYVGRDSVRKSGVIDCP